MKLYKEAGINPMGGCLPLLVQLPILWGLYQALYVLANPERRAARRSRASSGFLTCRSPPWRLRIKPRR